MHNNLLNSDRVKKKKRKKENQSALKKVTDVNSALQT